MHVTLISCVLSSVIFKEKSAVWCFAVFVPAIRFCIYTITPTLALIPTGTRLSALVSFSVSRLIVLWCPLIFSDLSLMPRCCVGKITVQSSSGVYMIAGVQNKLSSRWSEKLGSSTFRVQSLNFITTAKNKINEKDTEMGCNVKVTESY